MPQTKLTPEQRRYVLLSGTIKKRMAANQVSDKQMANACSVYEKISPETFAQKKNHPDRFSYPQLMAIVNKLHFTEQEILEIFL